MISKTQHTWLLVLLHAVFWLAYFFTVILGTSNTSKDFWIYLASAKIPIVILFYFCLYFIYPNYLDRKHYFRLAFFLLAIICFSTILRIFLASFLVKFHLMDNWTDEDLRREIWAQLRLSLAFAGISLGLWYAKKNRKNEQARKAIEHEATIAELNALKHQINPHFLYNTLSFIYAKALPISDELATAIAKLSQMMRYSLNDANDNSEVSITKEVEHINNFLHLQKLRFGEDLFACFKTEIESDKKILPLVLITFIENAFKHGVHNDLHFPIAISLTTIGNTMTFKVVNKVKKNVKLIGGIGLANVKRRLELAYPGRYQLTIKERDSLYTVELLLN